MTIMRGFAPVSSDVLFVDGVSKMSCLLPFACACLGYGMCFCDGDDADVVVSQDENVGCLLAKRHLETRR